MNIERRYHFAPSPLAVEERAGRGRVLIGYAAVFGSLSQDLGGFREQIQPGAFTRTLAEGDEVLALFNHNIEAVLGRRSAGTLSLIEDSTGLRFEVPMPKTSLADDLMESVRRGDIKGASFSFRPYPDGQRFEKGDADGPIRVLTSVKLFDVAPTAVPAYPATSVGTR